MKIKRICLHQYSNNVDDMCTKIKTTMMKVEGMGKTYESILRYSVTILRSGPNAIFNNYINRLNDDIETKTGENKHMKLPDAIQASRVLKTIGKR